MTVETTASRVQYNTNGTNGPWTVPFPFLQDDYLRVIHTSAAGVDTQLVLDVDYFVAGAGDASGTVTTSAAIPAATYPPGGKFTVLREVDALQESDYVDGDAFPAERVEDDFDRLSMAVIDARSALSRALVFPPSDSTSGQLPPAASRANMTLGFDSLGRPTAAIPASGSAADVLLQLANAVDPSKGPNLVAFNGALNYAAGTIGARLKQDISVLDLKYMTLAQIVDVVSYTGALDVTACIQAALEDLSNTTWTGSAAGAYSKGGGKVYLPPGKWRVSDTLRIGANSELIGAGATGATASSIAQNTGTVITWVGSTMKWVISSATYETATGTFAPMLAMYTGAQHDSDFITKTHGIKISGLNIDAGGAYGGIRLLSSSGFDVQDCIVYNVAVPYLFNTSYGGRYGKLYGKFGIYGVTIINCNSIDCGELYAEEVTSSWVIDNTTRLVSMADLGPANTANMPDWSNKTFGIYAQGCINLSMRAQKGEHAGIGACFVNVSALVLDGYFESNVNANLGFVTTSGILCVFANAISGVGATDKRYVFGVNNTLRLEGCTRGSIYVGNPTFNDITISESDPAGDWEWSDSINFEGLSAFRVAAAGTAFTPAVYGYTTLGEALRRIAVSKTQVRKIRIRDGDTVSTDAQLTFKDKSVTIEAETGLVRPTFSIGAAGGGFIYRCSLNGQCGWTFTGVNVAFPAAAAVGTDNGLFLIPANAAASVSFAFNSGNLSMGGGYSLVHVSGSGALNWRSAFSDCGITTTTAAGLSTIDAGGAAVVANIAANATLAASIKAIGTNGWVGTVLSSNFP